MRARGVAFAAEAISSTVDVADLNIEPTMQRLERVILSKLEEFIPHYLIKVMLSYKKAGLGSGELYSQIIEKVLQVIHTLNYSDMLRFFEVYPDVSYIYDHTMNPELSTIFSNKITAVIRDKKFPTEDLCRVFNILVRTSPYSDLQDHSVIHECLGRLRHSVHDVPKEYFSQTLVNLLEF